MAGGFIDAALVLCAQHTAHHVLASSKRCIRTRHKYQCRPDNLVQLEETPPSSAPIAHIDTEICVGQNPRIPIVALVLRVHVVHPLPCCEPSLAHAVRPFGRGGDWFPSSVNKTFERVDMVLHHPPLAMQATKETLFHIFISPSTKLTTS